jgi:hypothetical protein
LNNESKFDVQKADKMFNRLGDMIALSSESLKVSGFDFHAVSMELYDWNPWKS